MKRNDEQLGKPAILYKNTKANIEAFTGLVGGEVAYATDTGEDGVYDAVGAAWVWGRAGSSAPATTAANDFQVGDGAGAWIKKTLAETITILRTSLDSVYAVLLASTAANDFQVGNGSGGWIKKTLAETITILRTSLDSIYAALSHTHAAADVTGIIPTDGWIAISATGTSGTLDSPSFEISFNADMTAIIGVGDRIKITQSTTKYFIVTKVGAYSAGATIITCYGGTDYTLVASGTTAITNPYYSPIKAPFGFPLAKDKWTVKVTDTSIRTQPTPTQNVWYNNGSITISIPIGCWEVDYQSTAQAQKNTSLAQVASVYVTLSTANNSESDPEFSSIVYKVDATTTDAIQAIGSTGRSKTLTLAAKTSYYLNQKTNQTNCANIYFRGDVATIVIRAVCAYL